MSCLKISGTDEIEYRFGSVYEAYDPHAPAVSGTIAAPLGTWRSDHDGSRLDGRDGGVRQYRHRGRGCRIRGRAGVRRDRG
ncbi:MAG: hypothetical protein CL803_02440, partial [Citromicrobium sp.]|nr:hypothetical protein [Citromicrobium sp.]